jgi:uncharacterized protein
MKQTYINFEEYCGHVAELCREIYLSNWRPDYVVGITRGGLLPATMISHYLKIPMYSLKVSLRDDSDLPESNLWMAEDAYNGKNILIVDDMNDSGATLKWIMNDWRASCMPNDPRWKDDIWGYNLRTAVIVDNVTSEFREIDYSSLEVNKHEDPQWIVFPYEEWWQR